MQKVHINVSRAYDVIIGNGILKSVGKILKDEKIEGKIAIVTDSNVAPLYLATLKTALIKSGYDPVSFIFPAGEKSKNLETLASILDFFAESGLGRKDFAIALGGGVVGDITGFAASVYMRGISYVQIPTTLLSSVDSSVGGKTAVDLKAGKNLAGSFIQPKIVITDTDTLKTLDKNIFEEGMAEVIKTAILGDAELFSKLEEDYDNLEYIISKCVSYKNKIVTEDEFETGNRKLLNLGHTPAHAIEKLSKYDISHGRAVAIGLYMIAKACVNEGTLSYDCYERIAKLLKKHNLPLSSDFSNEDIARECTFDKKRQKNSIDVIKIRDIGDCFIENMPVNNLIDFLRKE